MLGVQGLSVQTGLTALLSIRTGPSAASRVTATIRSCAPMTRDHVHVADPEQLQPSLSTQSPMTTPAIDASPRTSTIRPHRRGWRRRSGG